jgi:hypothetical protein
MPDNEVQRAPDRQTAPVVRASEQERDTSPTGAWFRKVRDRFTRAKDYETERRKIFDLCVNNVAGMQWTEKELKNRVNRPNPTINMLKQHCKIVLNDMRMNRPGPKVSPKSSVSEDQGTAEIIEGMIRDIEYASRADIAYDTADKYQVIGGFGYYGATVDYAAPESRRQELKVRRFPDPKCVYGDCDSIEVDGSDWKWCFVREKFTKEQWKSTFGDLDDFYAANNFFRSDDLGYKEYSDWVSQDGESRWLAEYWEIEEVDRVLVTLRDGTDVWEDELEGDQRNQIDLRLEPLTKKWPVVTQYLIDGAQVYDQTDWKGRFIPIVPTYADELMVDGKRQFFPLPIFALDAQQAINYVAALWIEAMSLLPKGKYVGVLGQFASKIKDWQHANTSTVAFLEYDPVRIGNEIAPPPTYQQPSVNVAEFATALQYWQGAFQAAIGQFDPSIGEGQTKDQSGKAIDLLQKQGSLAQSDFSNNSVRARLQFYKILIDLIPHVYSEEQEVRTIGPDEKEAVVWINKAFSDKTGKPKFHDIASAVRFEVIVDVGQNYHDLRQKQFDFAQKMLQQDPQLWQRIGWLLVKLADLGPLGDQMSKLLEPPDVQMQEQTGMDPQAAQWQQKAQQLAQQLHAASEIIEKKKIEEGAKMDREMAAKNIDYRMHQEDNDVKIKIALINAKAPIAQAVAEAQIERDDTILGYKHEVGLKTMDMGHEVGMSAMEHQQGLEQNAQQGAIQGQHQQSDQDFQQQQAEAQPDQEQGQ